MARRLNALADVYYAQGQYAEAKPLYKRALRIYERTLGKNHPEVAVTLENYADLLRRTNRDAKAKKMEAHAKAIRAKRGPSTKKHSLAYQIGAIVFRTALGLLLWEWDQDRFLWSLITPS